MARRSRRATAKRFCQKRQAGRPVAVLPRGEGEEREGDGKDGAVERLRAELTADHLADVPPGQLDDDERTKARAWASDARELGYDVADAVDTFAATGGGLLTRLQERAANLSRSRPAAVVGPRRPAAVVGRGPPPPYRNATEIVGLDAPRDDLIKKLLCDDDDEASKHRLKAVSIVGTAGLGKTTLTRMVYDTLKPRFGHGAFVSVSVNPAMDMTFRRMLRQLDDDKNTSVHGDGEDPSDETQLIDQLREFLRDKRYGAREILLPAIAMY
uniref:NB-ARC domain-containing protein n=1 Tax=Oryza brachyantha TaxID=4533 RepID=J3KZQ4_ORYBR